MVRIAVFVSGSGTNLGALIEAQNSGIIKSGRIVLVVSNKKGVYALERAEKAGIMNAVVESGGRTQAEFESELLQLLEKNAIDIIVLAGFMRILSGNFTSKYNNKIINVHPALIPSFCGEGFYGLHVHEAALEYGVKVTGATVHFVNEVPDGGRIIMQKAVEVRDGDTPQVLQRRVMEQAEWIILPLATEKVCKKISEEHMYSIEKLLCENTYPGRGIILGRSACGENVIAYFIMGRSENSRNRVFAVDGEGLKTQAFRPEKLTDPSLIIYAPVRVLGNDTIVTNGNQTDTVYDFMADGKTFEEALRTREYEPDAPNFTPRISGIIGGDNYKLSILKHSDATCRRFFYEYAAVNGKGHFIHTYRCDGRPIPSFEGEPEEIAIDGGIDSFTQTLWNSLNNENKVSLFVRFINAETGKTETRVVNKNDCKSL